MEYWLYSSHARVPSRSAHEAMIYIQARSRNGAHGVTGYLHREEGYYAQYIEGAASAIGELKRLIRKDWRHRAVHDIDKGRTAERLFSGWDMAFTDAETSSFRSFQMRRDGEPDISRAPASDLLRFMEATAHGAALVTS